MSRGTESGESRAVFPRLAIALALLASLLSSLPAWSRLLEDHQVLTMGAACDYWRPFTGHLTHRSPAHLLFNLALFMPLALLHERRRGSGAFLADYIFLSLCVALSVRLTHPDWESYRGLSGVAYGLIVLVLLGPIPRASSSSPLREGARTELWASAVLVAAIGYKTLLEVRWGGWIHAGDLLDQMLGVRFLPGSHLGGILGGLLLACLLHRRIRRGEPGLPHPARPHRGWLRSLLHRRPRPA